MKFEKPMHEIITEAARLLEKLGKKPFNRQDIIALIQWKYPDANEGTINPMIQGMTDNLNGGAPGAEGKNILHSVGRGLFELRR